MTILYVWLGLLTLALLAHIVHDAREFTRIRRLEDELSGLKNRERELAAKK